MNLLFCEASKRGFSLEQCQLAGVIRQHLASCKLKAGGLTTVCGEGGNAVTYFDST